MPRGRPAAGLLIHEGQLTYADEGLVKVVDLGEWWAERTGGLPLPLGCNIIRRDLGRDTMGRVSRLLRASISHALTHRKPEAVEYRLPVRPWPRPLTHRSVRRDVCGSISRSTTGPRGRAGLDRLYSDVYGTRGLIPSRMAVEFVA